MPQVDLSQAVEGLESAAGTVGGFSALGYGVAAGQIALALLGVEQLLLAALAGLVLAALGFVFQWKTTGEDPEQGD